MKPLISLLIGLLSLPVFAQAAELPTVTVRADPARTSEPLPLALVVPGRFVVTRTGAITSPLRVFLSYAGTAASGSDYESLPEHLLIPAGAASTTFTVTAKADDLVEGTETVIAKIRPAPEVSSQTFVFPYNPGSATATIEIADEDKPVVSIAATRPETAEPSPTTRVAPGLFTVTRRGATNEALVVYLGRDGTATPKADYAELPETITFAPNKDQVLLEVVAVDDEEVEPVESVIVRVLPPPLSTSVPRYNVDLEHASAKVLIHDSDQPAAATIKITAPQNGADFPAGQNIEIKATAVDPKGYIPRVEFFDRDQKIGVSEIVFIRAPDPGTPIYHSMIWSNPPAGEHLLTARGIDSTGARVVSPAVTVTVQAAPANERPRVSITAPANGSVFNVGEGIEVRVEAFDLDGKVMRVDLFADGDLLVRTNVTEFRGIWNNVKAGEHTLTAKVWDDKEAVGEAKAVHILVRARESFVLRELPDGYTPGSKFTVRLQAEPPRGAAGWAVEDRPPRGWTVSAISNEGTFDSATGKVKFGPFTDSSKRTLTYDLLPPANAADRVEFVGTASADGASTAVGGDRVIEKVLRIHPADVNQDFTITLDELTAYVAAWKKFSGTSSTIPISYVSRAGKIWRNGEVYKYDPASGEAPFCWVPAAGADVAGLAVPAAERLIDKLAVRIRAEPGLGASAFALEEKLPPGWSATQVSDGGVLDPVSNVIRFGTFFGSESTTVRYVLVPPPFASVAVLKGVFSVDGGKKEIGGQINFPVGEAIPLRVPSCEAAKNGAVRMKLQGASGQVCKLEASDDLLSWQPVRNLFLPKGELEIEESGGGGLKRFYRLSTE